MSERALNSTAAALLGFLHDGSASGWDLLRTARSAIGPFWNVTSSQVYRELAAMEREGLVRAGAGGARDRRPYTLTRTGRAAFAKWIRRPPGEEQIRSPLLLTISFGRHLAPDVLAEFAEAQRRLHTTRLVEYEATRDHLGPDDEYTRATVDFGIRYERAVLSWFDALPAILSPPDPRE